MLTDAVEENYSSASLFFATAMVFGMFYGYPTTVTVEGTIQWIMFCAPQNAPSLDAPPSSDSGDGPRGPRSGAGAEERPDFLSNACGALLLRGSHSNVCVECNIPNPNECVLDRAALRVPHFCRAIRGNCCLSPRESRDR